MSSDHSDDENPKREETPLSPKGGLFPLPFDIQIKNICPVEIFAKKFPAETPEDADLLSPDVKLSLTNIQIDEQNFRAQVLLSTEISFSTEPRLCEISFGILGLFTYAPNYTTSQVRFYLKSGAYSVLLPFVRELLTSLCTRIQVPVFYLPIISIASSPPEEAQT
jgi:preprotein translocase subunit SecB